jgi:hypothetical protein
MGANLAETSAVAYGRFLPGEDLDRLTDDFRSYYSLGYQPLCPGGGERHRVSVEVD